MTDHEAYAAGLREMADWIEANPSIPLPESKIINYAVDSKEHAEAIARSGGKCRKVYSGDYFNLYKDFGVIELNHFFYRKAVCERKVVGVETIPARFVEAHIIEAHTKEIVEWECIPILAAETEAAND